MNARLQLRLLKKPEAKKPIAKPVYARVDLALCGMAIDRRDEWRPKFDAHQAEQLRERCAAQSRSKSK